MSCLYARGELGLDEPFVHEGALGTTFTGRLHGETTVAGIPAVIPSIEGRAWITGENRLRIAAGDPFPQGYTVADIWGTAHIPETEDADVGGCSTGTTAADHVP